MRQSSSSARLLVVLACAVSGFGGLEAQVVDLSLGGAATVTIGPPEAVAAGAAFRIDDLPFRASGAVESGLAPGRHVVRFQPLPGWREPKEANLLVVGGAARHAAFEYQPLPAYYFKVIPPQSALPAAPLRFVVLSSDPGDPQSPAPGTRLTVAFSPQPAGEIEFDPDSGELRYQVHPDDRRDFTVTFRAPAAGGTAEGSVAISPAPALPSEEAVLHFEEPMPDPLSRDYLQIRDARSPTAERFNLQDGVHTRTVSISGRRLLFEALSTQSSLYDELNGDPDLKELKLYAETIIIRDPLALPGTQVVIHARELRFEGDGALDVTPPDWFAGKPDPVAPDGTTARSGADGLASPPMEIQVERLHSDPNPANPSVPPKRFILRGARAQDAGEGRDGRNIVQPGTVFCGSFNGMPVIYTACILPDGTIDNECGSQSISGENAVAAGRPGLGGAGGTFTSPFGAEIASLLDLSRGADGLPGQDHVGGAISGAFSIEISRTAPGGEPCGVVGHSTVFPTRGAAGPAPRSPAKPCECVERRRADDPLIAQTCDEAADLFVAECSIECRGRPACVRACREEAENLRAECLANPCGYLPLESCCAEIRCAGDPGRFLSSADAGAWLHPHLVRSTLLFVKDAYLNQRVPEAQAILEEYRTLIEILKGDLPPGEESDQFLQLWQEIESLLHRMDANLDYFGNPVTWVPLLSFEANLAAFTEEVDRAIPTLYLGYWVKVAAEKARSVRDAAIAAKEKLDQEIDQLALDHALAQEEMPVLMAEAEVMSAQVAEMTARLKTLEAELEKRAQENANDRHKLPYWRKALGVLGGVTKIIPLAQPYLGYVGVGIGLLSRFDPDRPLANLDKLPDLFEAVKKNPYALCAEGKAEESKEDPKKETKPKLMDRLQACGKILMAGVKDISENLKQTQADKKEVDAELEKLRASDYTFVKATKELQQLNARKQQLAERIAATVDKLTKFSSAVNENVLAIAQLDRDLSGALDALDHSSVLYVADMARRTTDRLLSYQYLMAKAYQYRLLRPYTGSLRLGRILERIRALIDFQDSQPVLSPDQFESLKAIYLEEVGRIAEEIHQHLNVHAPEQSEPKSFRLTAEEVATLNEQGSLEIDLARKGLFGANLEDLRIASIETQDLTVNVIGTIGTHATLRIRMEHSGTSRIVRDGQTYLFTHYRTERVNPITWTTVYDALSGRWTESRISAATESLLRFLLKLPGGADVILYSPPAALAKLVLSKEVTADNGVEIDVTGLTLRLKYDYAQGDTGLRRLEVQVSDELEPRILLEEEDQNGRQDGRGEFARSFAGPGTVHLEAPLTHGQWSFTHWEVSGGAAIASPEIDVNLAQNVTVRAVYHAAAEGGERFVRGDPSGDGTVDLTDAINVLDHLYLGGSAPACPDAADADDNGSLEITDAVNILGYLFLGSAEPPAPGPRACGADPTSDEFGPCVSQACR